MFLLLRSVRRQVLLGGEGRAGPRVVPAGLPLKAARHTARAGRRREDGIRIRLLRLLRMGRGAELTR